MARRATERLSAMKAPRKAGSAGVFHWRTSSARVTTRPTLLKGGTHRAAGRSPARSTRRHSTMVNSTAPLRQHRGGMEIKAAGDSLHGVTAG